MLSLEQAFGAMVDHVVAHGAGNCAVVTPAGVFSRTGINRERRAKVDRRNVDNPRDLVAWLLRLAARDRAVGNKDGVRRSIESIRWWRARPGFTPLP